MIQLHPDLLWVALAKKDAELELHKEAIAFLCSLLSVTVQRYGALVIAREEADNAPQIEITWEDVHIVRVADGT